MTAPAAKPPPLVDPARVLVAVISGKRPSLDARKVTRFLPYLAEAGYTVEWVVREDQAGEYEPDGFPIRTYPVAFADDYSRTHWRHPTVAWEPGGFQGAFPGREFAARSAAERGFDLLFQLDDNVESISPVNSTALRWRAATPAEMLDLTAAVCLSTNAAMLGWQLNSVVPERSVKLVRPGFPYSAFIERIRPGRLPYFGPFEDDVMHAMEYGLHGGPDVTAGIISLFRYAKNHGHSSTGMRSHYNAERGLELARRYPNNARVSVGPRSSSPRETGRGMRHYLSTRGFTPVRVLDRPAYALAEERITAVAAAASALFRSRSRDVLRYRAGLAPEPYADWAAAAPDARLARPSRRPPPPA